MRQVCNVYTKSRQSRVLRRTAKNHAPTTCSSSLLPTWCRGMEKNGWGLILEQLSDLFCMKDLQLIRTWCLDLYILYKYLMCLLRLNVSRKPWAINVKTLIKFECFAIKLWIWSNKVILLAYIHQNS